MILFDFQKVAFDFSWFSKSSKWFFKIFKKEQIIFHDFIWFYICTKSLWIWFHTVKEWKYEFDKRHKHYTERKKLLSPQHKRWETFGNPFTNLCNSRMRRVNFFGSGRGRVRVRVEEKKNSGSGSSRVNSDQLKFDLSLDKKMWILSLKRQKIHFSQQKQKVFWLQGKKSLRLFFSSSKLFILG